MIAHGTNLNDKNRFIALNAFVFFSLFWLLLNSFTNSSLAINPMSKEESNILTDPCRPLGKWLTSLIPYWSLLGWVAATLQRRPAGNGNSNLHNSQRVLASKLLGFYYTTNKEITNQNFSSCHYELVWTLHLHWYYSVSSYIQNMLVLNSVLSISYWNTTHKETGRNVV